MNKEQWDQICGVVDDVMSLGPQEREPFLDRLSRENPALHQEILPLLKAVDASDDFLEKPVFATSGSLPNPTTEFENSVWGDFDIEKAIGSGSFGTVYLATQRSLKRQVALKITPNIGEEAHTMARLDHKNIVPVYSRTQDPLSGLQFICMPFISGTTLEKLLESLHKTRPSFITALDNITVGVKESLFEPEAITDRQILAGLDLWESFVWLVYQMAAALEYAHRRGVIHLDIKPSNILLTPYGRPLLTDFNVSYSKADTPTEIRVLGGTPKYMSPEQKRVMENRGIGTVDTRSDIFSLGMVLRAALAVIPMKTEPLDFHHSSEEIETILDKATDPSPERRYQTAAEMAEALKHWLELRRIAKSIPMQNTLGALALRWPLWVIFLSVLVPQVIGSVVNISYNHYRIVSDLSPKQNDVFRELVFWYNLIFYPLGILFFLKAFSLLRQLKRSKPSATLSSKLFNLRRRSLTLPFWALAVTTLGWLPGSVCFPAIISWGAGFIGWSHCLHFFLSFTISWAIAMTYAFILTQLFCLRAVYPRGLGIPFSSNHLQSELAPLPRRTLPLYYLATAVPSITAILILLTTRGGMDGESFRAFQILMSALILLSIGGVLFSLSTYQLTLQILRVITYRTALFWGKK